MVSNGLNQSYLDSSVCLVCLAKCASKKVNDAYISLTLHFIANSWELKSYTLATYPFSEQHAGDNIVEKLKEVISELGD